MTKGVPLEEAKRRRRAQEAAARPTPRVNGHDQHVREVEVADWNSLGTNEAQDNLVAGILGEQQLAMLYGESGSGKSFLAFDMAAHYALGRDWLGHKVKGGGVLYIAAEGRGGWANRVEAFCRHHELDEEQRAMVPFGFVLESINLGRTGNGDVAAVIRAAERFALKCTTAIDLIVIDTMARATPGSNENDAGDMGAFVGNMDKLKQATKATQLIIHHSGKNAALGARGHSSLRAAVDAELEVERSEAGRVLRIRRSRDGNDGAEQAFALQVVEVGRDAEGQPINSCVVHGVDMPGQAKRQSKKLPDWRLALAELDTALLDFPEPSNGGNTRTTQTHFRQQLERAGVIPPPSINPETGKKTSTHRTKWLKIMEELRGRLIIKCEGDMLWRIDL